MVPNLNMLRCFSDYNLLSNCVNELLVTPLAVNPEAGLQYSPVPASAHTQGNTTTSSGENYLLAGLPSVTNFSMVTGPSLLILLVNSVRHSRNSQGYTVHVTPGHPLTRSPQPWSYIGITLINQRKPSPVHWKWMAFWPYQILDCVFVRALVAPLFWSPRATPSTSRPLLRIAASI